MQFISLAIYQTFYRHLGNKLIIVFALTFITAILESVGLILLVPLATEFTANMDATINLQRVFPAIARPDSQQPIFQAIELSQLKFIVVVCSLFVAKALFLFSASSFIAKSRGRLQFLIRSELFYLYSNSKYNYFIAKDPGEPNNLLMDQMNKVIMCFNYFIQFAS